MVLILATLSKRSVSPTLRFFCFVDLVLVTIEVSGGLPPGLSTSKIQDSKFPVRYSSVHLGVGEKLQ